MALWDFFKAGRRGRPPHEPHRDTIVFPNLMQQNMGFQTQKKVAYRPTPRNLRWFSLNPYARRAINSVKNPIAMLDWEIVPKQGIDMNKELERQIETAMFCFDNPNHDDSMRTLLEQVVEDYMLGAGAIEMQLGGDPERPLWLFPVDGQTIQIYPHWSPNSPESPRYQQLIGSGNWTGTPQGGKQIDLRNDELMYIRPNPTTATPFGHGPLEIAFNTVSRLLGTAEFAGNVATNSRPSIGIDLGDGATDQTLQAFRAYWRNEVEGQGNMPIFAMTSTGNDGKTRGPDVLRFYPEGDDGLYLKYQEFLQREIAAAFDISPQNLGLERDVNRSTGEVSTDRDRKQAITPTAHCVAQHFTRDALRDKLGYSQLVFKFKGIEADDEINLAKVYEIEYRNNAMTPNDYRVQRGKKPMAGPWGDKTQADVDIAIAKAKGKPPTPPKGS